jgi:hypothetical protein
MCVTPIRVIAAVDRAGRFEKITGNAGLPDRLCQARVAMRAPYPNVEKF